MKLLNFRILLSLTLFLPCLNGNAYFCMERHHRGINGYKDIAESHTTFWDAVHQITICVADLNCANEGDNACAFATPLTPCEIGTMGYNGGGTLGGDQTFIDAVYALVDNNLNSGINTGQIVYGSNILIVYSGDIDDNEIRVYGREEAEA